MKSTACPPPGEQDAVVAVVAALHDDMVRDYPPPGIMRRDAHPKAHGTVQGEMVVDPSIAADLRHGVFAHPGRTYPAWVRFSNCFRIQPDVVGDTRGMAVKLLGVDGEPLMDSEVGTQDFLAGTGDAFFIPDAERYVGFPQAASRGSAGDRDVLPAATVMERVASAPEIAIGGGDESSRARVLQPDAVPPWRQPHHQVPFPTAADADAR
jgi:hypothetical protein